MDSTVVRPLVSLLMALLARRAGASSGYEMHVGIESAPLYGNMNKYAYYFTDLLIGTPVPQRTSVIVDTGSRLVGFPCTGCSHCGEHLEPGFDVSKSKTADWLGCGQNCQSSCSEGYCPYTETYSEGSSISGFWFKDLVELGDTAQKNPPVRATLGCHRKENKLFYTQRANGIMGLAPSLETSNRPTVLQDLFRDKSHVDTQTFSICLASWGGQLTVGGYNATYHTRHDGDPGGGGIKWIGMRASHYYFVFPEGLALGSKAGDPNNIVGVGQELFGVTIVDSGTTYTYLPEQIYENLVDHLHKYCDNNSGCGALRENYECFRLSGSNSGPVEFPPIRFLFGGVEIEWRPDEYLHQRGDPDVWCQTFRKNTLFQTVLGISWIIHKDIIFDIANNQLGIAEANCPEHHYPKYHPSIFDEASMVHGVVGRDEVRPPTSGLSTDDSLGLRRDETWKPTMFLFASLFFVAGAVTTGWLALRRASATKVSPYGRLQVGEPTLGASYVRSILAQMAERTPDAQEGLGTSQESAALA